MAKQRHNKKPQQQQLARERIRELFRQAKIVRDENLSDRYIFLARKIAMKYKVKLTSYQKRRFCKHCYKYFSDDNYTVRIHQSRIIYYCKSCKNYTRIPLK